jgi:hypothetical protein
MTQCNVTSVAEDSALPTLSVFSTITASLSVPKLS